MESYFLENVVDFGNVKKGQRLNGGYMLNGKGVAAGLKKADGGCTCGGKPHVDIELHESSFSFNTVAKIIGGNKSVRRNIVVEFKNKVREVVTFKYSVI